MAANSKPPTPIKIAGNANCWSRSLPAGCPQTAKIKKPTDIRMRVEATPAKNLSISTFYSLVVKKTRAAESYIPVENSGDMRIPGT